MSSSPDRVTVDVEGRDVALTNLGKVLWPALGLTKAWLVAYYETVADIVLRHVGGHPVTLHRFPDGVDAPHWYQTRAPAHPPWVRTAAMRPPRTGKVFEVVVLEDRASLVWAANMGTIEVHPYLGRVPRLDEPTVVVFDLDPGAPAGIRETADVACRLRDLLDDFGLTALVKTSGNVGLHVYVPLNTPHRYDDTKAFARAVGELLRAETPEALVTNMARRHRHGKVFVDWSQNDPGKSTVAPYSLRGNVVPTVSTPLTWDEVEALRTGRAVDLMATTPGDVVDRLERMGDIFEGVTRLRQRLPELRPGDVD